MNFRSRRREGKVQDEMGDRKKDIKKIKVEEKEKEEEEQKKKNR